MQEKKRVALETISEACETYQCKKVFCLFSGGDDSTAALAVAVEHPNFVGAVHLNTGTGVEATREHAIDTCMRIGCPLVEYKATENTNAKGELDPQIYEQHVMEYGFPGPTKFGHGKMYNRLKERSIRCLVREHTKKKEKYILASGCRSDESNRRMGTTKRIQQGELAKDGTVRDPNRIWVNHIHDWTKTDTLTFAAQCGLPRNPVSALIGRSGECNCGAYAQEGEIEELCSHDLTRSVGEYLRDLEQRVMAAGFPWRYHEGPPRWWLEETHGQMFLFEMNQYENAGPLCQRCEEKRSLPKPRS